MSLISSIQLANSALQATQIGLQVVGQNISNANTPGYTREIVQLQPGPTQRSGNLLFGSGVQVQGIVQQVDRFLQERLRNATSDSSGAQVTQQTYSQLEGSGRRVERYRFEHVAGRFLLQHFEYFESAGKRFRAEPGCSARTNAYPAISIIWQSRRTAAFRSERSRGTKCRRCEPAARASGQAEHANRQCRRGGASGSDAVGLRDQRNSCAHAACRN